MPTPCGQPLAHGAGTCAERYFTATTEPAQYASRDFAALCDRLGVLRSRGAVGTSADNAAAESFNASMKRETLQGAKRWPGARAARLAVFRWVTRYNTRHPQQTQAYTLAVDIQIMENGLASRRRS